MIGRAPLVAALLAAALPAGRAAAMLRMAVIVGNDVGGADRAPLHYAEEDAAKMARVLSELGDVAPDGLFLLQGKPLSLVQAALDRVSQRIAEEHARSRQRTLLIFYFSGHSDGEAIELGADRLSFSELEHRLTASGADVRVAIVDSCRSGALLTAKGGRRGPPFEINLRDDPPTSGQVLLTSSAANEEALESREIRGSYFTHHLISGLRGAADSSGDGRVTLGEAYRYAYARTVAATAATLIGPQHPGYGYQLSGMGELVLTELSRPTAALLLPEGFVRALISDPWRDEVLAEVPAGAPRRIAVPAGDYLVRLWRGDQVYAGRVVATERSTRTVAWGDLGASPMAAVGEVGVKGDAVDVDSADLAQAIKLCGDMQDEQAAILLRSLLSRKPVDEVRAKVHVYLGLLAFNAIHPSEARREFKLALRANSALELPALSSPKARLAFAEARQELAQSLEGAESGAPTSGAASTAAPAAATSATPEVAQEAPRPRRSHALSYVLGGVGLAALGVFVYGEVEVASFNSLAAKVNLAGAGQYATPQVKSQQGSAVVWQDASIALAVAGGLGLAGAAIAW